MNSHLLPYLPDLVGQSVGSTKSGLVLALAGAAPIGPDWQVKIRFQHAYYTLTIRDALRFYYGDNYINLRTGLLRIYADKLRPQLAVLAAVLPAALVGYISRAL